jgi:hypothetical protein
MRCRRAGRPPGSVPRAAGEAIGLPGGGPEADGGPPGAGLAGPAPAGPAPAGPALAGPASAGPALAGPAPAGRGLGGAGAAGVGRPLWTGVPGRGGLAGRGRARSRRPGGGAGVGGGDAAGHSATSASAAVSWWGCGRDTSRTRMAVTGVSFIPGMWPPPSVSHAAGMVLTPRIGTRRMTRAEDQKICGHQGAGSQDMAADSAARAPGRSSVACPAPARAPSLVPPR